MITKYPSLLFSSAESASRVQPEPTRVLPPPPRAPAANWILRGAGAILQGRLPYRLQGPVHRLGARLGFQYRQIRSDGFRVIVRRGSVWDENTVARVIGDRDYARPEHIIRPDDTVIDIGANIGCFTLVAARAAGQGRVLAFEPDSGNFEMLTKNVALNGLTNVVAARQAVSGTAGVLRLFKGQHGPLHSTFASRVGGGQALEEVESVTLRQIMDQHDVKRCFLKMNCEGAEYGILFNTPPEYLRRIDRVALEYHQVDGEDKLTSGRRLAAFLQSHGLEVFEFSDFVGFDCGYIRAVRRG